MGLGICTDLPWLTLGLRRPYLRTQAVPPWYLRVTALTVELVRLGVVFLFNLPLRTAVAEEDPPPIVEYLQECNPGVNH